MYTFIKFIIVMAVWLPLSAQANQGLQDVWAWGAPAAQPHVHYQPTVHNAPQPSYDLGVQRYDSVNEISSRPRDEVERIERLLKSYGQPTHVVPTTGMAASDPMAMFGQYMESPMAQALWQEVRRNPAVGAVIGNRAFGEGVNRAMRDPLLQLVLQMGMQALTSQNGGGMDAYRPIR
jgi:hypothetical protein